MIPAVYAAPSLYAVIQTPKTPTNQTNLSINVVVFDQNASTVQCYYQKNGGAWNPFGGTVSVDAGGNNTANCQTDGGVINDQGTYNFYATVNDGVSPEFKTATVGVTYNTSDPPGTPISFSKDRVNTCDYKISFHTADDGGKTVKVEVYRSGQTSFTADNGSRVDTISIGSNQDGTSITTPPVCNQDYYFAVRAFDVNGNGSGLIGDSNTVTVNTTTTTTTTGSSGSAGAIPAGTNGNVLGAESGLLSGTTGPTGTVLGEASLSGTPTPSAATTPTPAPKPGLFTGRNIGIGGGLLIILIILFILLK